MDPAKRDVLNESPRSGGVDILFAVLVALLFFAFAAQLVYHTYRTSVTVDEPVHILAGYRHLQCGDFGINPEHPPLLKMIAASPLLFREIKDPPWECGSKLTSKFDSFSYGNTFLVENGVDSVVIPTRLAASSISLLLAVLVFLAAREMFGRWEAVTALAILAFEPNLIAHGSLVTTDMAISAAVFATVYALYRFGKQSTLPRFLLAALAFGFLLTAKHSAAVFTPILFTVFLADSVIFNRMSSSLTARFGRRVVAFAGMFIIGWTLLWACYGFRYHATPSATQEPVSIAAYLKENGRPETVQSFPARVTEAISWTHTFPESYVLGMADVIAWGARNSWVFGRNYPTGRWFYFPVSFAVKSSLALLLLLPLGLLLPIFKPEKRRELLFLLGPAVIYFALALTSTFTTGVRHILPVYPLFIVAAAAGAVWLCRRISFFRYALVALLVYNAAAAVRTAPMYLAFANDLWGGYENTYRIFSDSNVETGQSLKLVNEYVQRENLANCWIVTFVHPELLPATQPCRVLPSNLRIMISRFPMDPVPTVAEGTFFISVVEMPPRGADEYLPITASDPVAVIGGNIFVYRGRFEIPLVAAMSHVHRSSAFLRMNRVDEALAEARTAVELGPNDPRTHLALGIALLKKGGVDEARSELETAIVLAKPDSRYRINEVRALQELEKLNR
jgi:hypothetical protein